MTLGTLIRSQREALGWTQKRLAERAGLSPQYVNDVELGRRPSSVKTTIALALAVDLDPHVALFYAGRVEPGIVAAAHDPERVGMALRKMREALFAEDVHVVAGGE